MYVIALWSAQYANDDGNRVTVTYDLYDDQTFKWVTTVTPASAQLLVPQQGDQGEVLSRTAVTGTWDVKPRKDGGNDRGTVELQVTGCVGGDLWLGSGRRRYVGAELYGYRRGDDPSGSRA